MDISNAAAAAGVKPEQLERWEAGDDLPTFRQAQNIAQALHAPFGFFFLPQAPVEEPLLPDLRTLECYLRLNFAACWLYYKFSSNLFNGYAGCSL